MLLVVRLNREDEARDMGENKDFDFCENCGQCCTELRTTPFMIPVCDGRPQNPAETTGQEAAHQREDFRRLISSPPEAQSLYVAEIESTVLAGDSRPCAWLNLETMRCRFYEQRRLPAMAKAGGFDRQGHAGGASWRRRVSMGRRRRVDVVVGEALSGLDQPSHPRRTRRI